jgi:hypothetical protein
LAVPLGAFVVFFAEARRSGAFFAAFFLIALVLPIVFLRLRPLVRGVFLRFGLAFFLVAIAASPAHRNFERRIRCRIKT